MKAKKYSDGYPGCPAEIEIALPFGGRPEITINDKGKRSGTSFVVRTMKQGQNIIATLQAALDEWQASKDK